MGVAECLRLRHPSGASSSRIPDMPQADPGASSKREGRKENTDLQAPPGGNPTTTQCHRGAVQALRGQEACPRSQGKCTGTGNPSRPLLQAGSASEGLALSLGSCEVTSSGVMGHKTQSPDHVRGPRCQSGSEGTEKGLAGLKITCQERLGGRRTRAYAV